MGCNMFYHNTIRKYTLGLLDFFKDLEVQYLSDNEELVTKIIPIHYKLKEKKFLMDKSDKQILNGNTATLPRGVLEFSGLSPSTDRQTTKFNKIHMLKNGDNMEYQYNYVSYEFDYNLKILCRGMNEACQIVEEIAPKFNPNVAIDLYDAENEEKPTRIALQMTSISIDTESFEEKSMNICTVSCGLKISGYLFQPIQKYSIIKELKISLNTPYRERELMEWDVVNKKPVQPPTITSLNTEQWFYIEPLSLELNDNKVTVKYNTNIKDDLKIEFWSETCSIKQDNTDTCAVEYIGDFDISCSIEYNGYRVSIYKEFRT